MSEETATTTATEEKPPETEQTVPYERFKQANTKAKEAADKAKELERQVAELREQVQERENQGLPELERLKKDMERAEKRAEEAERKAAEADAKVARTTKERWVTAAAQDQNFADPSDASAFVNLDDIEDEKDAERAVKRLASQKKHLLKAEEAKLPGRVLKDGQRTERDGERPKSAIDPEAEAQALAQGLGQLLKNRWASVD
jgi:hypothetical protein